MENLERLSMDAALKFVDGVRRSMAGFRGPDYADFNDQLTVAQFGAVWKAVEMLYAQFGGDEFSGPPSLADIFRRCNGASSVDLERVFLKKNSPSLESDLHYHTWEMNMALGSSTCSRMDEPLVNLELTSASGILRIELNREELDAAVKSLQSAVDAMSL